MQTLMIITHLYPIIFVFDIEDGPQLFIEIISDASPPLQTGNISSPTAQQLYIISVSLF